MAGPRRSARARHGRAGLGASLHSGLKALITGGAGRAILALGLLAGCAGDAPEGGPGPQGAVAYEGIETRLMDDELVNLIVTLRASDGQVAVARYADCAAAQYALIRGYGFARHVRTNISEEGGVWRGDAVYTISSALPDGLRTLDAETVVADCAEQGIPTV